MSQMPTAQDWERIEAAETNLLARAGVQATPHNLDLDGERIHYLEAGNPSLPPLVMIHGRGGAAALFYTILPLLAPHRHCIAIDLRGWGLSSRAPFTGKTGQEAIEWWRDGALRTIEALGLQRFDLMGHSLGGITSLMVALAVPEKIDHIVLEDPAGLGGSLPLGTRLYFNFSPERLARSFPRSTFDAYLKRTPVVKHDDPEMQKAVNDFVYTLTTFPGTDASAVHAFNRYSNLTGTHFLIGDKVTAIQAPLRAIWGTKDDVIPLVSEIRERIGRMPHGDLVTIEGATHSPHFEMPQAFTRLMLEGLARGIETPVTD